jgi:hypothetical protein
MILTQFAPGYTTMYLNYVFFCVMASDKYVYAEMDINYYTC